MKNFTLFESFNTEDIIIYSHNKVSYNKKFENGKNRTYDRVLEFGTLKEITGGRESDPNDKYAIGVIWDEDSGIPSDYSFIDSYIKSLYIKKEEDSRASQKFEDQIHLIDSIIKYVKDNFGNWSIEKEDGIIIFSTREHGNVGKETPGYIDIKESQRMKRELVSKYGIASNKIELYTTDEWVYVEIDLG